MAEIPNVWFQAMCECGHPRDSHALMEKACLKMLPEPCKCLEFKDTSYAI